MHVHVHNKRPVKVHTPATQRNTQRISTNTPERDNRVPTCLGLTAQKNAASSSLYRYDMPRLVANSLDMTQVNTTHRLMQSKLEGDGILQQYAALHLFPQRNSVEPPSFDYASPVWETQPSIHGR